MKYHRYGKGGGKVKGKRGAGILFTDGKSILLLKRQGNDTEPNTWGIPGGSAKEGESAIDNARREVREECSLSSIPGYRSDTMDDDDGHHKWTTFLFVVPKPFEVKVSHEHSESEWIDLDKLSEYDLHPKFKTALPRFLNCIRRKFGTESFEEWVKIRKASDNLSTDS